MTCIVVESHSGAIYNWMKQSFAAAALLESGSHIYHVRNDTMKRYKVLGTEKVQLDGHEVEEEGQIEGGARIIGYGDDMIQRVHAFGE